jgi:hypothetical protein
LFVFDLQLISFLENFILDDSLSIVYLSLSRDILSNLTKYQLFYSFIVDSFYYNYIFKKGFYDNNWFHFDQITKVSPIFFFINHPESSFFSQGWSKDLKNYLVAYDYMSVESIISPSLQLVDFFSMFFIINFIIVIYFSYYVSFLESVTVDSDYLSVSIMTESEKEIASLDDIILSVIIIIYVFGWFFYIHAWTILGSYPELLFFFYLLPLLVYLVFGMPTFLLIDFGNCFLMFIRGSGAYTSLLVELMYDYINFGAFYVRLSVQWVRLLIMFLTFIVMHDTLSFCNFVSNMFLSFFDYLWEDLCNVAVSSKDMAYLTIIATYSTLFRLLFELVHTLFVCTAQLIAFFAITFWFFSFLYTFFVLVNFEMYFKSKRLATTIKNKNLKKLKAYGYSFKK